MRVTTWAEYGLIVSVHLAKRAGQGPVAARELSEQERPSPRLRRADSAAPPARRARSSRCAAHGAATCSRVPPQAVSVKDVIEASEHVTFESIAICTPLTMSAATRARPAAFGRCGGLLRAAHHEVLASVSLADLSHAEPECTRSPESPSGIDHAVP